MFGYHFEVLPNHPKPYEGESLSSYRIRLTQLNSIDIQLGTLSIFFPNRPLASGIRQIKKFQDFMPDNIKHWATVTGRKPVELMRTTCVHLCAKFGRANSVITQSNFLGYSLSKHQPLCPACLKEKPYYRLLWRFSRLEGCPIHSCKLIDKCQQCNSILPLYHKTQQIGKCANCGFELADSILSPLSAKALRNVHYTHEVLQFLLAPHPFETVPNPAELLGKYLNESRVLNGIAALDLLKVFETTNYKTVSGLHGVPSAYESTRFDHYWKYFSTLSIEFRETFEQCLELSLEPDDGISNPRVAIYRKKTKEIIQERLQKSEPISINAVAQQIGVQPQTLSYHNEVRELFTPYERNEDFYVAAVDKAVRDCVANNEPVTQIAIAEKIGVNPRTLGEYPKVKELFMPFRKGVEFYLAEVKIAIRQCLENNERPTIKLIAKKIGVHPKTLRAYPEVRELFNKTNMLAQFYLEGAERAVDTLNKSNTKISISSVAQEMGIDRNVIYKYQEVKEFVQDAKSKQPIQQSAL